MSEVKKEPEYPYLTEDGLDYHSYVWISEDDEILHRLPTDKESEEQEWQEFIHLSEVRSRINTLKSELSAKDERVKELEKFVKKHYQYILDHVKMHSYSGHLSDAMDTVVRHESWSAAQRHFEMCFPQLTQQHTTKGAE
jgi:uncharacterized protein YPO0396